MSTPTPESKQLTLWFAIVFEGAMLPIALVLALIVGVQPWAMIGVDAWYVGLGLAGVLPMLIGFVILWRSSARWVREIHASIEEMIVPLFRDSPLLGVAAVSVLAGVGEEMLFRGVIQEALAGPIGLIPALCVASILFGLVHWITPGYGLVATLVGFYLGALYIWTGNLLVPIIVHAVYDFVILRVYLYYAPSPRLKDL